MTVITATDLKQNTMRLQEALRDDLLITKRNKPFVVVMDYEKYRRLEAHLQALAPESSDNEYPSITLEKANERVADAVKRYRGGEGTYLSHAETWDAVKHMLESD
jgi:prevent-host-death family protein